MVLQQAFTLKPRARGIHLITQEVERNLPPLPPAGLVHLFIRHTSAALILSENADPSVRRDLEGLFERIAPQDDPCYTHTLEGSDDMPAHAKSVLAGASITIPVTDGRLNLGRWQGICLCEFRNRGGGRNLVATVVW